MIQRNDACEDVLTDHLSVFDIDSRYLVHVVPEGAALLSQQGIDVIKSVLIVDREPVCRLGLGGLIRSHAGLRVAAEAASVAEAVKRLRIADVDVILLSVGACGRQGIKDFATLRARSRAAVVMLVPQVSEQTRRTAVNAGVAAFLSKRLPADRLLSEIIGALGAATKHAEPSDERRAIPKPHAEELDCLTAREREVVALVGRGLSNKAIAEELGVSVETAKVHMRSVLKKLGVHSRFDAALLTTGASARQRS
jgi:DNA-binding NarL/FixJ family response regulator